MQQKDIWFKKKITGRETHILAVAVDHNTWEMKPSVVMKFQQIDGL